MSTTNGSVITGLMEDPYKKKPAATVVGPGGGGANGPTGPGPNNGGIETFVREGTGPTSGGSGLIGAGAGGANGPSFDGSVTGGGTEGTPYGGVTGGGTEGTPVSRSAEGLVGAGAGGANGPAPANGWVQAGPGAGDANGPIPPNGPPNGPTGGGGPERNPDTGLIGLGGGGPNGPARPGGPGAPPTTNPPTLPPSPTNVRPSDVQVAPYARSAEKNSLIEQLMQRAKQGTNVDANDPVVKAQTDAYAAAEDRARRNEVADQAEKGSPYSTGQQAGVERMAAERSGQRVGQFQAEVMTRELTARRDEIKQALDQWGDTLTDEEKQGLQRELENMNAAIEQRKMGDQNSQFYAGLSQQDKQFYSQLQQGEKFKNMDDALARYQTATQNAQFFAKLAQDGDLEKLRLELDKTKVSNDDKNFLLQLAQNGKFGDLDAAYKRMALSQDNNQFLAKLAQEGKIADMDDLFRRMQLAQEESQFLDRLGFDTTKEKNYWDWKQRGND